MTPTSKPVVDTGDLTEQIVVRITPLMHAALTADAEQNGRSLGGSVRFHLRHVIEAQAK